MDSNERVENKVIEEFEIATGLMVLRDKTKLINGETHYQTSDGEYYTFKGLINSIYHCG